MIKLLKRKLRLLPLTKEEELRTITSKLQNVYKVYTKNTTEVEIEVDGERFISLIVQARGEVEDFISYHVKDYCKYLDKNYTYIRFVTVIK